MNEHEWICKAHPNSTPTQWALAKNGAWTGYYIVKGGRKNPGWRVLRGSQPIARMNPNLTVEEAQSAAKMLAVLGAQQ